MLSLAARLSVSEPHDSPFPGMDPYLEQFRVTARRLIIYSCDQVQSQLAEDLYARVEERFVLECGEPVPLARYPDVRVVEYPHGGLTSMLQTAGLPSRSRCEFTTLRSRSRRPSSRSSMQAPGSESFCDRVSQLVQ